MLQTFCFLSQKSYLLLGCNVRENFLIQNEQSNFLIYVLMKGLLMQFVKMIGSMDLNVLRKYS